MWDVRKHRLSIVQIVRPGIQENDSILGMVHDGFLLAGSVLSAIGSIWMKLKVVDLFSGLGGFSEAFLQRGHDVLRVDNDPGFSHVPGTMIANIMELEPEDLPYRPDLVEAAPPCNCFSTMSIRYYWDNGRPKNETVRFAIDLVKRALWLKEQMKPRYWIFENPIGMMKYVLGPPQYTTYWASWYSSKDLIWSEVEGDRDKLPLKPTWLWGIIPNIEWPSKPKQYAKISRSETNRQKGVQGVKHSAITAQIPYRFSEALCLSIEQGLGGQTTL